MIDIQNSKLLYFPIHNLKFTHSLIRLLPTDADAERKKIRGIFAQFIYLLIGFFNMITKC